MILCHHVRCTVYTVRHAPSKMVCWWLCNAMYSQSCAIQIPRSAKWIGGDRRLGVSRDAHCLGAETACGLGGREGGPKSHPQLEWQTQCWTEMYRFVQRFVQCATFVFLVYCVLSAEFGWVGIKVPGAFFVSCVLNFAFCIMCLIFCIVQRLGGFCVRCQVLPWSGSLTVSLVCSTSTNLHHIED